MGVNILHIRNVQNVGRNMAYWSSKQARCLCGACKGERGWRQSRAHRLLELYQRFLTLARSNAQPLRVL